MKRSESVALELVQDIVEGGLKSGDPLRMESELSAEYGVSRPSLREALRLLEFQGLIQVRPGPGAGTIVGRAEPENLARTIVLYLHVLGVSYQELLRSWADTQAWLAASAASNPDRKHVKRLMEPFARPMEALDEEQRSQATGAVFHANLYELAGNSVTALITKAMDIIALDHVLPDAPRMLPDIMVEDHSRLAQAIVAGDGRKAADLMRLHCEHIIDVYRELWPDRVGSAQLEWHMFK